MPDPDAPNNGRTTPTLAQFQTRATAACTPYQKSAYVPVWRRACESLGDTPLDQITTMDLRILQQAAVAHAVPRASSRGGRYAGERVVRAMRALFRMAERDGWIDQRHNPAAQLPLPRRKPSTRPVEDFLTLDQAGRIRAAYPFCAVPTRHRVRIADTVAVWSMCAIDALGIPAMLGADVVICSTDPVSGESITVTTRGASMRWQPAGAVVFVGRRPGGGPAATACCDALNFFTGEATARVWITGPPGGPGRVLDQAQAAYIAVATFGPLLNP